MRSDPRCYSLRRKRSARCLLRKIMFYFQDYITIFLILCQEKNASIYYNENRHFQTVFGVGASTFGLSEAGDGLRRYLAGYLDLNPTPLDQKKAFPHSVPHSDPQSFS